VVDPRVCLKRNYIHPTNSSVDHPIQNYIEIVQIVSGSNIQVDKHYLAFIGYYYAVRHRIRTNFLTSYSFPERTVCYAVYNYVIRYSDRGIMCFGCHISELINTRPWWNVFLSYK
jgi:hypothetical protein